MKKKMLHRLLAMTLAFVMVLGMLPDLHLHVHAAGEEKVHTCICATKCTQDSVAEGCTVCSAEGADLSACAGEPANVEGDFVEVSTFEQLEAALAVGGSIRLTADIELEFHYQYVSNDTIIDLNGWSIVSSAGALWISKSLTVTGDGTIDGGNYISGTYPAITVNYGELNLQGGAIKGKVEVYHGIATVSGGHIDHLDVSGGTATVTGGSVDSFAVEDGTLVVKGGTFGMDPADYLAEGYIATYNETDKLWTVTCDHFTEHDDHKATCTTPSRCDKCDEYYGEPLGHTFGEDYKCGRCGADCPHESYTGGYCADCGKIATYTVSLHESKTHGAFGAQIVSINGAAVTPGETITVDHGVPLTVELKNDVSATREDLLIVGVKIGSDWFSEGDQQWPAIEENTVTFAEGAVTGDVVIEALALMTVTVDMAGGWLRDNKYTVSNGIATLGDDHSTYNTYISLTYAFVRSGFVLDAILDGDGNSYDLDYSVLIKSDLDLKLVWRCEGAHDYNTDGTCTLCGAECPHESYTDGYCAACGKAATYTVGLMYHYDTVSTEIISVNGVAVTPGETITVAHGAPLTVVLKNSVSTLLKEVRIAKVDIGLDNETEIDYPITAPDADGETTGSYNWYDSQTRTLTIPGEYITGNVQIDADAYVRNYVDLNGASLVIPEELLGQMTEEEVIAILKEQFGYDPQSNSLTVDTTYHDRPGDNVVSIGPTVQGFFGKEGYVFTGFTDSEGNTYPDDYEIREFVKDMVLTAQWECAGHVGGTATCNSPAICTTCQQPYGKPDLTHHDETVEYDDNGFCPNDCYQPALLNEKGEYEISNAGQLYWFAAKVNDGEKTINAILVKNITVNENVLKADGTLNAGDFRPWIPIGDLSMPYQGTFDGGNHTVKGLYVHNDETVFVGLIGYSMESTIRNVTVADSYLHGARYVGGVVGKNDASIVSNCYNTASIIGNMYVGGVVGVSYDSCVQDCSNAGSVNGQEDVGGVVGVNSESVVTNCYNTGTVSGSQNIGGVVGSNDMSVTHCYNIGAVTGSSNVGGVAGESSGGIINCYYLDTCGAEGEGISKTDAQFRSGEVAFLLNDEESEGVWKQTIGTQNYPGFAGQTVYYGYISCAEDALMVYSNDSTVSKTKPDHTGQLEYANTGNGTHTGTYSCCGTEVQETCVNIDYIISDGGATCDLTCRDCKKTWGTITILAPACKTYGDGYSCEATVLATINVTEYPSENAEFTYYKWTDGQWTKLTEAPADAGKYRAEYVVLTGGYEYQNIIIFVDYEIAKADPAAPTGLTATYGDTLSDVALPDGWAWVDPTASVGPAGNNTHKAVYTPVDSNYNPDEADLTVKVICKHRGEVKFRDNGSGSHDGYCADCGEGLGHYLEWPHETTEEANKATCTTQAVCDACGAHYGEKNADIHTEKLAYVNLEEQGHKAYYPCCQTPEDVTAEEHSYSNGVCDCTDKWEFTLSFYAVKDDETPVATFQVPYGTELVLWDYDEEEDEETYLGATEYLQQLLSQIDVSKVSREHYTFLGWDLENGPETMTIDDCIYAIWNPIFYKITWDLDGGYANDADGLPIEEEYDGDITLGTAFAKEGYTISHFEDQYGNRYDLVKSGFTDIDLWYLGYMPGYDVTFTARWECLHPSDKLEFRDNGDGTHSGYCGQCGQPQGNYANRPHDFKNADHKCACGAVETFAVTVYDGYGIADKVTLSNTTAVYGQEYVTHVSATVGSAVEVWGIKHAADNSWTGNYWFTFDKDTDTLRIRADYITGDLVIEAVPIVCVTTDLAGGALQESWQYTYDVVDGKIYDYREYSEEGAVLFGMYIYDEETGEDIFFPDPNYVFQKNGYRVCGYMDAAGNSYPADHAFPLTGDISVALVWECVHPSDKMEFRDNGDGTHSGFCDQCSEPQGSRPHVYDETPGQCDLCGYACDHKNTQHTTATNNGDTHSFACTVCALEVTGVTHDYTHDAQNHKCICGDVEMFTITWDMSGCDYELYYPDELPTKLAYNVGGWDHQIDFARIEAPEGYQFVKFVDGDGNELSMDDCTGSAFYTHRLWVTVSGDMTIQAVVEPGTYKAAWSNGDGGSYDKSFKFGEVITIPNNEFFADTFRKSGYNLVGWEGYTEGMTMPAGGISFTAIYEPIEYTITFDTDGGTKVDPITQGYATAVTVPAAPTKEGYHFVSWDAVVPASMPLGGMTLKAVWEQHTGGVATCTAAKSCTTCGAAYGETDPDAHAWDKGEITTAPTCTKAGIKTYTCKYNANHSYTEDVAIDADAHAWDEGEITTAPTCTKAGVKTYTCKHNAEHTYTEVAAVDEDAHAWDEGEITTASTCTKAGVKTYTCKHNAEHTYTEDAAIDEDAHTWDEGKVTTAPTCTKVGVKTYTCKHNAVHTRTEDVAIDADAHAWDEGKVTTAPTCTRAGIKTYTCKHNAAHTYTEDVAVDPNAHDMKQTAVRIEPTCEAAGKEAVYTCANGCGHTTGGETVSALGHDYQAKVTKEATCTESGVKTFTCANDSSHTYTEPIPAKGHAPKAAVEENRVEATCTEAGSYEMATYCSACGAEISRVKHTVPVKGHSFGAWTVTKEATCTVKGTERRDCVACDHYETRGIAFTGHSYTDPMDPSCEVCGERREVYVATVPMLRLYNPATGEHHYTGSAQERDTLVSLGWNYEGVAWNAPVEFGDPVFRYYNPNTGDHHYTMSSVEGDDLIEAGWIYEGVAWNSASSEHLPIYRLYNPNATIGTHHYTGSAQERDDLVAAGWNYEGIAWFALLY